MIEGQKSNRTRVKATLNACLDASIHSEIAYPFGNDQANKC